MSKKPSEASIEAVIGEPLSGISFVQDYVEFHFDGKIVRSLTMPTVHLSNVRHTFPGAGSRDALCSMIGLMVDNVIVREGNEIEIAFSDRAYISIPLGSAARSGPEAAHYVPGPNQPIIVW